MSSSISDITPTVQSIRNAGPNAIQPPTPSPQKRSDKALLQTPTLPSKLTVTAPNNPKPFHIIGYVTDSVVVETIPFNKLTEINYAFLIPNTDGTFLRLNNGWKIKGLVGRSHQNGVKVLISIGGWGQDEQFKQIAADQKKRAVFISETIKILNEYDFDGVDIDWEYPNPGQSAKSFTNLMRELRAAIPGKLLTAAVISSGDEFGQGIPAETFALVDFINVMTYDEPNHATLKQFTDGLDYWLARGVPPEKLVPGIPFYSRPGEIPYLKLVQADPAAANTDIFNYNGSQERYNGLDTVKQKTLIAKQRAGGVMFWTLEQDASGDASLLNAIFQASK